MKGFHREIDCQQMVSAMNSYLKVTMGKYTPDELYSSHFTLVRQGGTPDPAAQVIREIELHMKEHYDPLFKMDYTGTNYTYIEIPAKLRG